MQICHSISEVKEFIKENKLKNSTIGLVPTMGYLHEGHLTLMRQAKAENDKVVVSIFVNPIQFGAGEDLNRYPRNIERDIQLLKGVGVDAVFIPEVKEMYPEGFQTEVQVMKVSQGLCGSARPGHFSGVTTVVTKLFNITEANKAYFGLKDAQQLQVIRRMVKDLNINIEINAVPIVREEDGLALSSRNSYLNPIERKAALVLSKSLQKARELVEKGAIDSDLVEAEMQKVLQGEPLAKIDYLEIVDFDSMERVKEIGNNTLIALAVWIGQTRLIDNILLGG